MPKLLAARVLGVGLAAAIAALTLVLAATGQLDLYVNPSSAWLAIPMAVLALVGCALSFALPLGAEADHGHDHGDGPMRADAGAHRLHEHEHGHEHEHEQQTGSSAMGGVAVAAGGILSAGIVGAMLIVPPATLSAELAMSRDTGTAPLFHGADNVALAVTGDTDSFGVGEWANVFATATSPEAFDGDEITLTGFVTPDNDGFGLTRLVITHCVIDAQPATVAIATDELPDTGQWVTVNGTIRDVDGRLQIEAASVDEIDEPQDPYEY